MYMHIHTYICLFTYIYIHTFTCIYINIIYIYIYAIPSMETTTPVAIVLEAIFWIKKETIAWNCIRIECIFEDATAETFCRVLKVEHNWNINEKPVLSLHAAFAPRFLPGCCYSCAFFAQSLNHSVYIYPMISQISNFPLKIWESFTQKLNRMNLFASWGSLAFQYVHFWVRPGAFWCSGTRHDLLRKLWLGHCWNPASFLPSSVSG